MKISKIMLILGVCFFGFTQSLFALNREGAVTLTLGSGYYIFANKRHIDNTDIPNVAFAYNFDTHWSAEAFFGLLNSNQPAEWGGAGEHGVLYLVDGLYHFRPDYAFTPYVAFGIGMLNLNPNRSSSDAQGNINAGLGAKWFFDNSIAFRGEIKDVYTMSGGKNDVILALGISFLMGGNNQATPKNYK